MSESIGMGEAPEHDPDPQGHVSAKRVAA